MAQNGIQARLLETQATHILLTVEGHGNFTPGSFQNIAGTHQTLVN